MEARWGFDEAPLTIQGVNDACSSQHHSGQRYHILALPRAG